MLPNLFACFSFQANLFPAPPLPHLPAVTQVQSLSFPVHLQTGWGSWIVVSPGLSFMCEQRDQSISQGHTSHPWYVYDVCNYTNGQYKSAAICGVFSCASINTSHSVLESRCLPSSFSTSMQGRCRCLRAIDSALLSVSRVGKCFGPKG